MNCYPTQGGSRDRYLSHHLDDPDSVRYHQQKSFLLLQVYQSTLFLSDQWVPAHNADLLMDAAGPSAELWHAPNAQHSQVLRDHPEEYERRVLDFFDAHLRGAAATEEAGHDPRGRAAGDNAGGTS